MKKQRARAWVTDSSTVCLRDEFANNYEGGVREFWVPTNGGYVREVDSQHWGTLGRQVCNSLASRGGTLWATRETLKSVILAEYRNRNTRLGRAYGGISPASLLAYLRSQQEDEQSS